MKNRVLLGMSGGIDSSVAAMLLQEKGFEVIGITFLFGGEDKKLVKTAKEAQTLANKLGINHIIADVRQEFKQIVEHYFIQEYSRGNTPFPCAVCNPKVKFKYLNYYALRNNCDYISTGHYARIQTFANDKYIYQGIDQEKDQSFFLWGLNKEIRTKLIFPLGDYTKIEIRDYARKNGYDTLSKKKDSFGVCFIQGNDYRNYLKDNGLMNITGNFINGKGEIVGQHKGIFNYTVGQRRGLGINANKPLFVSEIRADKNEILVQEFSALYKRRIRISNHYFFDYKEITNTSILNVRIRYRLQNTPCTVNVIDENVLEINLLEPLAMVAKGQTAVFYDGERVVGGGFIDSSE